MKNIGKNNPNWKGGHPLHKVGNKFYKMTIVGYDHHLAITGRYAYLHRVNAEKKLGRKLLENEIVTFDDNNTLNCELDNLIIVQSKAELHFRRRQDKAEGEELKRPDQENELIECKCGCGEMFLKYDEANRPRYHISGHNSLFGMGAGKPQYYRKKLYKTVPVETTHHLHYKGGWAFEHFINAEIKVGRKLEKYEMVYFKDGNKIGRASCRERV